MIKFPICAWLTDSFPGFSKDLVIDKYSLSYLFSVDVKILCPSEAYSEPCPSRYAMSFQRL